MKNSQHIYYLIGATILIIVVNTVFFLLQSSRNARSYAAGRETYEIVETAQSLLAALRTAESSQRAYLLTSDTSYLKPYEGASLRIDDLYLSLFTSLGEREEEQANLDSLSRLIKLKRALIAQTIDLQKNGQPSQARAIIESNEGRMMMENIEKVLSRITQIENTRLLRNHESIEKQTKRIQIFSVVSNWLLLLIVISALVSIVQNQEKISELFREVEDKNKRLESQKNELQSLSQDLIKQNNELERFAYVASHDLRSPGVNMIALLQLYEEAKDEEEKAGLMEIIREVSDNLIVKLDDLIEMLRSKHESYAVHEELNFKQIYNSAVKNLSADIKKSHAKLDYDFSEAPHIRYPKSYLESIMQNLLSNAIKYRSPGRRPEISVRTYRRNEKVFMEVKDNGLGIDLSKHSENLFGIYQTFHGNNDSKGVGLYITKAQIVAMGGNIEIESTPDVGTTFTISFN
ncbi:CHASE3 domain-containing protein [Pedobacter sp. SYSU D00535]|uniref:sensor histidine kinase n=1 Tax=Pedobacter sp. SYSU D00535 TaxID=2810308 RepID=UPI001A96D5EE|nr:CHASE3 domain-containing protein [Pedobacter sp. SYSU D00535]